jgi:hypothetical protein
MSEQPDNGKKRDYFSIFLTVACIALAVLVVMLARENRSLKKQLADAFLQGPPMPEYAIKVGDTLEPFGVMDDAGGAYTVEYGGEYTRTLLLVFSSQCPACDQTLPIWSEMVPEYENVPGLQILAVQLDRIDQGEMVNPVMAEAYPFPIFGIEIAENEFLRKIPFIPATILADARGTVVKAWYELPGDEIREELRSALGN